MEKLRLYYNILGTEIYYKEVSSPEEAKNIIDAIADFLLFAVDNDIFPDHCSFAGLEYFDEEENDWYDWYDDDGYDFDEHFANLEEKQ